jgi:PAS domain S-box-containing protein
MENFKEAKCSAISKKRKSLKLYVVSTYITVSLVTIGVIFVIILSSWKASVNDALTRLKEDSHKHIYAEIDSLTNLPLGINEANYHILQNNILNLQNPSAREVFFASVVLSSGEEIYSFSYGTAHGEYYGARRNAENEIEVYRSDRDTDGHSLYYSVNEDLSADELVNDYGPFDPRTRDWYKTAAQTGQPVFSPLYKHFIKDDFALTAAHPIYDKEGKLKGVLGTHIILSKLNSVLKAHISDIKAETYIIEKNTGELVANSYEKPNFEILSNGTIRRINISEVGNKAVIASYQDFLKTGQSEYVRKTHKDKLYINISEYKKEGLEWLILTSIPENQFIADMSNKIQIALLLTLMVLIISSFIYFKLTDFVLKPIRHLVSIAGKYSSGNLLERAIITRNDEIGDLAAAYNQMAQELYNHIHYLEARISEHTSELENTNAALKKNEDNLRLLLDSTTEGILGIDLNERFTFCNASCLRLLGYQQEDLIGKNLHYQIHYQTEEEAAIPLAACGIYKAVTKGEKMYSDREVLWRADGTCFPVELYSYPQYRDGELVGAVLTFIDITERKIAQKELIQAKEQAEAANIAKS